MSTHSVVINALRSVLGAKLTAYIAGRKTTKLDDDVTVDEALRLAKAWLINQHMQTSRPPYPAWDPVTLRSWWMGMNPMLGDESPATHVRDGDFDTVWQAAQHDYIS